MLNLFKLVVFGQNLLYSGKIGFIWAKFVLFEQLGCIRAKMYLIKIGCIRVNWLFLAKLVEFGQIGCI